MSPFTAKIQTENPEQVPRAVDVEAVAPLAGLSDKEFADLARSILVCITYRANEGIASGLCTHFGMWGRIGMRVATIKDPQGGFIEVTRGGVVNLFLEYAEKNPELKYLVMIDNDETIQWDAPIRLAHHGVPVVSGVVCGYNPDRGIFACFTVKDENGVPRFPSFRDTKVLPADGLIEAEQVGAGLLCIRKDVLDTMQEMDDHPFFIPEDVRKISVNGGIVKKGEDIVFCERAAKYGFKRYVDLSVHALHHKTIGIGWPVEAIDPNVDAIEWKPSPFDYKGVM